MRESAGICGHLRTFADICGHLPTSADICGHLEAFCDIEGHCGVSMDIDGHLRASTDICGQFSTFCEHPEDRPNSATVFPTDPSNGVRSLSPPSPQHGRWELVMQEGSILPDGVKHGPRSCCRTGGARG
eukprot:gene12587-biopygen10778